MEKINIAELLKDAPKGMELDCTIFADNCVEFNNIANDGFLPIRCRIKKSNGEYNFYNFTKYGCWIDDDKAKCVIFPKGKTTWEGFQPPFKDGDIISMENACGCHTFIYNNITDEYGSYGYYTIITSMGNFKVNNFCSGSKYRLATEEEKQKLFDALKDNGYKWNAETKTLEKWIEPKFKVGDRIHNKTYKDYIYDVLYFTDKGYKTKEINAEYSYHILFGEQDNYELAPNKFDITTLKPFDKVLTRANNEDTWVCNIYSHALGKYYVVLNAGLNNQCIPFNNETKHLVGTTKDCEEFYKTWEE